MAEFKTKLHKV